MNSTIETMLNHTSVRAFTDEKISEENKNILIEAAQSAATSSFQQTYSIIEITDKQLRQKMAISAGNQDFINEASNFFIFCADVNRSNEISKKLDIDISKTLQGIDALLLGTVDATLAAQNMAIAAESMGMGICYIGGVRDGIEEISELLNVPDYVTPLFGLVVGYPAEENEKKPRMPKDVIYHENGYNNSFEEQMIDYDNVISDYYAHRTSNPHPNKKWSDIAIHSFQRLPREHMKDFLNNRQWAKH